VQPTDRQAEAGDTRYRRQILAMVISVNLVFGSTLTILVAALATVADDLGTTESTLAWTVTAPFLALSVGTSLFGKLGDVWGLHRIFRFGAVVTAVATLASALAPTALTLIALRTIAALGGAAAMPTGMAMILRIFPDDERPGALGWFHAAITGAPAVGLALGGFVIDAFGWRIIFIFYGLVAVLVTIAAFALIKPFSARPGEPIAIMFAVFTAGEGVSAVIPIGIGLIAAAALAAFVAIERRHSHPLLPLGYLKIPNFRWPLITTFCLSLAYQGGLGVVPLLLQDVLGFSLGVASALLLFRPGTFSAMSAVAGQLLKKRPPRTVASIGAASMVTSGVLFLAGSQLQWVVLVVGGLMAAGCAFGFVSPSMNTALADALPESDMGVASGVMSTAGMLGAAIGLQLFVSLLGSGAERSSGDFLVPFVLAIVLGTLSLAAARGMDQAASSVENEHRVV